MMIMVPKERGEGGRYSVHSECEKNSKRRGCALGHFWNDYSCLMKLKEALKQSRGIATKLYLPGG